MVEVELLFIFTCYESELSLPPSALCVNSLVSSHVVENNNMIIECICPTSNYYDDFERHSLSGHKKLVNNPFYSYVI